MTLIAPDISSSLTSEDSLFHDIISHLTLVGHLDVYTRDRQTADHMK